MKAKLGILAYDTEFEYEGRRYKKGSVANGKTTKCYPKLGGKFQENMGENIADTTEVEVT